MSDNILFIVVINCTPHILKAIQYYHLQLMFPFLTMELLFRWSSNRQSPGFLSIHMHWKAYYCFLSHDKLTIPFTKFCSEKRYWKLYSRLVLLLDHSCSPAFYLGYFGGMEHSAPESTHKVKSNEIKVKHVTWIIKY